MNRRQALMGMGALSLAAPRLAHAARRSDPTTALTAIADELIASGAVPGVQIAVGRGNETVFDQAFGLANLETRTSLLPTSPMRIGSLTKQFTAATLLSMEGDGLLALTDPLSKYWSDFPRGDEIILDRMLSHTSGLGNYTARRDVAALFSDARQDRDAAALLKAMLETDPLMLFDPGQGWSYSNTAYVLLGLVIEKVTGRPFGDAMRTRVLQPAGLILTQVDDATELVPDRAGGYTPRPGSPGTFDNAGFISMTYPGAAGNLRGTAGEMVRWHQALLGGRVLPVAGLARMLTPARTPTGELPSSLGQDIQYGYGLSLTPWQGRATVSHTGGIFGFASQLTTWRDPDVTLAVIVNSDAGLPSGAWGRLRQAVLQA